MFKTPFSLFIVVTLILLTGCIIPGARKEKAEIELQRNDSIFYIDEADFKFRIALPKDLMINHAPQISLDDAKKTLEISCGPSFKLLVEINDQLINPEGKDDGVFTRVIVDHEDNSYLYTRNLPDGRTFDFGLIQQINIQDTFYTFCSAEEGDYTLQDVLKMRSALASVKL
jgi:hypothetical protein